MKTKRHSLILIVLGAFIAAANHFMAAQPALPQTIAGLGTATFPTSTHSAEAQTEFIRGLLLLHVFEYDDAAKAFQSAEKIDPTFAMAYWGEAMTHNHPVWNELDVPAGQAALNKLAPTPEARAAIIADPRQKAFLAAVEILYTDKGTNPERDAVYATAMQMVEEAYRKDDESQLFYSLALLGRSEGVRDVPTYLQAAAIAKAAYDRNPNHPGAAHYWIHGMDDPDHAAGALVAARSLSKIAPDAGHAQHMCSHIFMALGMWQEVVDANIQAMKVVDDHARAAGRPIVDCGHYAIWLQYAYDQQGRHEDANRVLASCQSTGKQAADAMDAHQGHSTSSPHASQRRADRTNTSLVSMRGTAVIESGQGNTPGCIHGDRHRLPRPGSRLGMHSPPDTPPRSAEIFPLRKLPTEQTPPDHSRHITPTPKRRKGENRNLPRHSLRQPRRSHAQARPAICPPPSQQVQRAAATIRDSMAFDFRPARNPQTRHKSWLARTAPQGPQTRQAHATPSESSLRRVTPTVSSLPARPRGELRMQQAIQ